MSSESPWTKRIKETGQYKLLPKIIDSFEKKEIEHQSESQKESYDRLHKGISVLSASFNDIDTELISPHTLSLLGQNLQNIQGQLDSYYANPGEQHLNAAHAQLDAILQNCQYLFIQWNTNTAQSHAAILDGFNDSANAYLSTLKKSKDALTKQYTKIEKKYKDLDTTASGVQEQLNALKTQNSDISTKQNETFNQSQTQRQADYSEFRSEIESKMKVSIGVKEKEFKTALDKQLSSSGDILNKMEAKLLDAQRVFQNLGAVVQTGKYQEFADKESHSAKWLRRWASGSFALMFIGTCLVIYFAEANGTTWNLFLLRFLTVATLAIPGVYFARESTRHRSKEHQYRKMQLELTSLSPFIEFLDDTKKKEITEKLVEKYFGKEDTAPVADDQILTKKDFMEIVSKIK